MPHDFDDPGASGGRVFALRKRPDAMAELPPTPPTGI